MACDASIAPRRDVTSGAQGTNGIVEIESAPCTEDEQRADERGRNEKDEVHAWTVGKLQEADQEP